MRPVVVIQHLEPEGPGRIASAFADAGRQVEIVRIDRGDPVPTAADDFAALVVMGGPMSATTDEGFATRAAELALLRVALGAGRPILGVCLGAQMLAAAAGGQVVAGDGPEIGWGPIDLTDDAVGDALFGGFPSPVDVLHWHGETYRPPDGAVHLATSPRYPQQAFRVGEHAWGLQFHVEVDAEAVDRFVRSFGEDAALAPGGASAIARATSGALAVLQAPRDALLARFVRVVEASEHQGHDRDEAATETRRGHGQEA